MNSVGVQTDPQLLQQPAQPENGTAKTSHWSRSRVVHVVAGVAVLGLGALAGFAISFFASTFASVVVAGTVSVILGGAVFGYLRFISETSPIHPSLVNATPSPPKSTYAGETLKTLFTGQEQRAQEMLTPHGYHLYSSTRDGNCFYDAIAHQCPGVKNALELRMSVAEFAKGWHERHQQADANFSPIEGRAHARLLNDVNYSQVRSGLDEIASPNCFADQIDAYFVAQVLARPIVIINIKGEVTLAVNGEGKQIDKIGEISKSMPKDAIILIHDNNHFMGVDPKKFFSPGATALTVQ